MPATSSVCSGSTYQQFLDAAAAGIPDGVLVDALSFAHGEALVMSFDVTVKLGDLTVAPGDLVLYDTTSFSMFFDAAAAGVAPGLDLDAAYVNQVNGHLFLSFDGSGVIGNPPVTFDDEDVLEYDPDSGSWEIAYDGSLQAPEWPPADLKGLLVVAQPETPTPTATSMVATATRTATDADRHSPPDRHRPRRRHAPHRHRHRPVAAGTVTATATNPAPPAPDRRRPQRPPLQPARAPPPPSPRPGRRPPRSRRAARVRATATATASCGSTSSS